MTQLWTRRHEAAKYDRCRDAIGGCSRRSWLQLGAASTLGLSLPQFLAARDGNSARRSQRSGPAQSCVVIFLWGGPSQQDLWDLKPGAPSASRGEFQPIATNVSGLQIGEHLPHLAQVADKYTLIRSMTHKDFEHGTAAYTALTGQPHPKPGTNTPASPDDFPTYGSLLTRVAPTSEPVPDAVVLGPVIHQGNRPPVAGQNAGFLGPGYEALRIDLDPNDTGFHVDAIARHAEVDHHRISRRQSLLKSLETLSSNRPDSAKINSGRLDNTSRHLSGMQGLYDRAFDLLSTQRTQQAFDLERESAAQRDAYGRTRFGQTLVLARRLIEAHVPLITINWSKQNADQWDTHSKNYPRLKALLPPFDRGLSAFLTDLDDRGLLKSTLVVCLGEFGRTPKLNKNGGRDHWPDCYSVLATGGGIVPGRVFGASNRTAAYPVEDPVAPWDLAATMYHLLGVDPDQHINNRQGQPLPISRGQVVTRLF
ncbi:MAG: DUF1501 domain-containing protein [Planctomycetaceae bacterium]